VLQLRNADVFAFVGLDLEIGWMPLLLEGARNQKIMFGGPGYVDVSKVIPVLDVPRGNVDRSMGDVHPLGNPHYWLDPENGRRVAKAIQAKLAEMDAANAAYYQQREADFEQRLTASQQRWRSQMAPYKGLKVVTYHRSWPNFADAFGLDVIGYVEPKPGIPPSPGHTLDLQQEMKLKNVKLLLVEPYFDMKTPNAIGRDTGAKVLVMPPSVGGVKEASDYIRLFDYDIDLLVSAIKQIGTR
jgi:ABC-type Zn uptake system ZnuABC Zn-binding protein ZnuA